MSCVHCPACNIHISTEEEMLAQVSPSPGSWLICPYCTAAVVVEGTQLRPPRREEVDRLYLEPVLMQAISTVIDETRKAAQVRDSLPEELLPPATVRIVDPEIILLRLRALPRSEKPRFRIKAQPAPRLVPIGRRPLRGPDGLRLN